MTISTPPQPLSCLLTTDQNLITVISTWLWVIVLLDWPFIFTDTKITNAINTISRTYTVFTYYYPSLPDDPIDAFFGLGDVRDWICEAWATVTDRKFYRDAMQKRRVMTEFYVLVVFLWSLYFVYYLIFRFEGLDDDIWYTDFPEVKPVDIPAHWLQR